MTRIALSFALALALSACGLRQDSPTLKVADTSNLRKELTGEWKVNLESTLATNVGTTTFSPDGGMITQLTMIRTNETLHVVYEGYWQVAGGFMLTTITNTSNPDARAVLGHTNHLKIVHLDEHSLIFQTKSGESRLTR